LLTGYQAVVQPPMQGRGRNDQLDRRRRDRHDISFGKLRPGLETGDAPVGPQIRDPVGLEPVAASGRSALPIENARDDRVRALVHMQD
jgi:hypothetical protein